MSNFTLAVVMIVSLSGCHYLPKDDSGTVHLSVNTSTAIQNSTETTDSTTPNNQMNRSTFWRIINKAHQDSQGKEQLQDALLVNQLTAFTPEEIIEFEILLQQVLAEANDYRILAAQKLIEGWVSDDPYLYFRTWLIAQGETTFREVLRNPDSLVDKVEKGNLHHYEGLLYASTEAYKQKTGKPEEDESFPRVVAFKRGFSYDFIPTPTRGEKPTEEQLPQLYPKLWAKFK